MSGRDFLHGELDLDILPGALVIAVVLFLVLQRTFPCTAGSGEP
jgi:hypothetical protein